MKCPDHNCVEGIIPEITTETEQLPLICPECQKRFCPSPLCGHRELDESNRCSYCGRHFPEPADEEHNENSSYKDNKNAISATEGLEDFMRAIQKKSRFP
jgi:hypothetical protein